MSAMDTTGSTSLHDQAAPLGKPAAPELTREQELEAASLELAAATERYQRAQAEAVRVNPPLGTPQSQSEWSAWLASIFREGPRERVVSLSDEQLASIGRYAKNLKIVTPFGYLVVVAADELPQVRAVDETNADDDCGGG